VASKAEIEEEGPNLPAAAVTVVECVAEGLAEVLEFLDVVKGGVEDGGVADEEGASDDGGDEVASDDGVELSGVDVGVSVTLGTVGGDEGEGGGVEVMGGIGLGLVLVFAGAAEVVSIVGATLS
jgi:hypothetical protein